MAKTSQESQPVTGTASRPAEEGERDQHASRSFSEQDLQAGAKTDDADRTAKSLRPEEFPEFMRPAPVAGYPYDGEFGDEKDPTSRNEIVRKVQDWRAANIAADGFQGVVLDALEELLNVKVDKDRRASSAALRERNGLQFISPEAYRLVGYEPPKDMTEGVNEDARPDSGISQDTPNVAPTQNPQAGKRDE